MSMGDSKSDALHPPSYERGVADERARCIKVLEDLRDSEAISVARYAWVEILDALEAPTSPVAASPVGGEQ